MSFPEPDFKDILNRQMRSLSRRSRSVFEARTRLEEKEVPEELVEAVVTKLLHYGFLNDQRYAGEYVRSRLRAGYGHVRIRRELKERGVDSSLISQALEEEGRDIPEEGVFEEMMTKRIRAKGEPEDFKQLKSLTDYLLRRGFRQELVRKGLGKYYSRIFR